MTRTVLTAAILYACAQVPTHAPSWEQTSYDVRPSAWTASGIGLDGALDPVAVDAIADAVDACLAAVDVETVSPDAQCWEGSAWVLDRPLTVLAVPGEPSCTRPGLWLLPDSAGDSCDQWGKPTLAPDGTDCSAAPCRWAVATQDGGRTVVVPEQGPYERMGEGFARVGSACLYPWSDPQTAGCSGVKL